MANQFQTPNAYFTPANFTPASGAGRVAPRRRTGGGGGSSQPTPAEEQVQQSLIPEIRNKPVAPPKPRFSELIPQPTFQSLRQPTAEFFTPAARTTGEFGERLAQRDLQRAFESESIKRQQSLEPGIFTRSGQGQAALERTQGGFLGFNLRNTPEFQSLSTRQRASLVTNEFFESANPRDASLRILGELGQPRTETEFGRRIQAVKDRPRNFAGVAGGFIGESALLASAPRVPKFETLSLRGLEAQPFRTVGVQTGKNSITGGKEFEFAAVRQGASSEQIVTFKVLEGSKGRTFVQQGESVVNFRDPLTGKGFSSKQFFSGGTFSKEALGGRNVRGNVFGEFAKDTQASVGRGFIQRPGGELTEFKTAGVSRRQGNILKELNVQPTSLVLRNNFPSVRGRPSGRTDVFFRPESLGSEFRVAKGRGRSGKNLLQFQQQDALLGISEIPKQAPFIRTRPSNTPNVLSGGGAESVLLRQQSSFSGQGLYERTNTQRILSLEAPRQKDITNFKNLSFNQNLDIGRSSTGSRGRLTSLGGSRQREILSNLQVQPQRGLERQGSRQQQPLLQVPRQTTREDLIGSPSGFNFGFPGGGRFSLPGFIPGGDLSFSRPSKARGKRKFRRTPSLVSIELGLFSTKPVSGEISGLVARPILRSSRKRRRR